MKFAIYSVVVALLAIAGVLDICQGSYKEGVVGLLFATANGLIFLVR